MAGLAGWRLQLCLCNAAIARPKRDGKLSLPLNCRALIDWKLQPTHRTGDMTTDMPFPAYAPGLYTAIAAMADIGLPIYITETGICDHTTLKRPSFFQAYFDQVTDDCGPMLSVMP
jgi:hypothetical protein